MNIGWNIWTYKYDSDCVVLTVESMFKKIPHLINKILIWDDANNPLEPHASQRLRELGCLIFSTDFNRNGNLLGIESFRGMAKCYKKCVRVTQCEYVAKIDSDILVVNSGLDRKLGSSKALFSMIGNWNPYGNIYMMHTDAVNFAYEESQKTDPFISHKYYHNCIAWPFLEDRSFYISSLISLGEERVAEYKNGEFWINWNFDRESKRELKNHFQNNICVNFGTRSVLNKIDGDWITKRKALAEKMRYVLDRV